MDVALTVIHGDERFLIERAARAWVENARRACAIDLNVEVLDSSTKLDIVRRSFSELPFLDPYRYVVLRDPQQLSGKKGRTGEDATALAAALRERSPTTKVAVVALRRLPPSNPILALLREESGKEMLHMPLRGRDLRTWLDQRLREAGLRVRSDGVDHMVRVCGNDLGVLDNEVQKLSAFAASSPGKVLSREDIAPVIAGSEQVEVWGVLDRLLSATPGRGAEALDGLLSNGVASQYILVTLAGQLRDVLIVRELLDEQPSITASSIAHRLGVPSWRAERLRAQAQRIDVATIIDWLRRLQNVDARSKLGEMNDVDGLRAFGLHAARSLNVTTPQ